MEHKQTKFITIKLNKYNKVLLPNTTIICVFHRSYYCHQKFILNFYRQIRSRFHLHKLFLLILQYGRNLLFGIIFNTKRLQKYYKLKKDNYRWLFQSPIFLRRQIFYLMFIFIKHQL